LMEHPAQETEAPQAPEIRREGNVEIVYAKLISFFESLTTERTDLALQRRRALDDLTFAPAPRVS